MSSFVEMCYKETRDKSHKLSKCHYQKKHKLYLKHIEYNTYACRNCGVQWTTLLWGGHYYMPVYIPR